MNNEDKIKELFAEKLGNLEAPVNPELWSAISSQIGTAASVTSTGLSIVAKTIIGISAASVIGVGTYFLTRTTVEPTTKTEQTTPLISEVKVDDNEIVLSEEEETISDNEQRSNSIRIVISSEGSCEDPPIDVPRIKPLDLFDNSTFINTPTPNLIEARPTEASKQNDPVVDSKQNSKKDTHQDNMSSPVSVDESVKKGSFEITKMPNVFGLNERGYFSIEYEGECSDFQITIMDSKQNVVFSSNRPDFQWLGTDLSGNPIEPGKYVYIITAVDADAKSVNKFIEVLHAK